MKKQIQISEFDIENLDTIFHLKSFFPKWRLRAPLGVPLWGKVQKKIILDQITGRNASMPYSQAVNAFESRICHEVGTRFCIGTSSGRDAIKLCLLAMCLKPGARVLLPDFCCFSVLLPVLELGLIPVFVDISESLQIDSASLERVIKPGDKVIIVPHLFGDVASIQDVIRIARNNGTMIIDDAAQAIGLNHSEGRAGSAGDCGLLSFGLFKPVSTMGGGALVTNDENIYYMAKKLAKTALIEETSRKSVIKIYFKMVWRHYTYGLFLVNRWLQQKGGEEETGPLTINKSKNFKMISKFDALMVASLVDHTERYRKTMKELAIPFASQLKKNQYLKSLIGETKAGFPRWPFEFIDSDSVTYADFFRFMFKNGIEVQPAYRPLHKIISELGLTPEGEYNTSRSLYNRIVCLPFGSEKNNKIILDSVKQFSAGNGRNDGK